MNAAAASDPSALPAPAAPPVTVERFAELFDSVSAWGRYAEPGRGAWNRATAEHARRGAAAVRDGTVVSMALPWNTVAGVDNPKPALHHMTDIGDVEPAERTCHKDFLAIDYHGKSSSHLDALSHIAWRGQLFDGRTACDEVGTTGTRYASVSELGVLSTRGVLLDVPAAKGLDWLEPGTPITTADLLATERHLGVELVEGDVLVLRSGHFARRRVHGAWDSGARSAGLHPETMPLLAERGIVCIAADGDSDVRPSPVPGMHSPIHVLALTAMGVPLLDNLDLEPLARACAAAGRHEFQITLAPLNVPGGTGSPLNPVAVL
jgi:kynurenine formamidase